MTIGKKYILTAMASLALLGAGIMLGSFFAHLTISLEKEKNYPWDLRQSLSEFPEPCRRLKAASTDTPFLVDTLPDKKVVRILSVDPNSGRILESLLDAQHRHYMYNFDSCQ